MADFSTPSNLAARFLDAARLRENHICRAAQKDLRGEAREKSPSGGVLNQLRWSEAIERNEAYESFSAARWLVTEFKGNGCGD